MNIALIIAGGNGCRINESVPKQFIDVCGAPVLVHTTKAFELHKEIDAIGVVCLKGWEQTVWEYAKYYKLSKLKWIFPGGETGMQSIRNGLDGLYDVGCSDSDIILIHDAVRPMVSDRIISTNIATCKKYGNAITGIKCQEAVLESEDMLSSTLSIPRGKLVRTQTPQSFYLRDIFEVHKSADKKGIKNSVSSCTLIAELNEGVVMNIVQGSEKNIKITTAEDLEIFRALYMMNYTNRGV